MTSGFRLEYSENPSVNWVGSRTTDRQRAGYSRSFLYGERGKNRNTGNTGALVLINIKTSNEEYKKKTCLGPQGFFFSPSHQLYGFSLFFFIILFINTFRY